MHTMIQQKLIGSFSGLRVGDRLASDRELAVRFSVALLTINKAMKQLERDGYVVRRHGSGTFLASHERLVRRTGGINGNLVIACPDYFSSEYWTRVSLAHGLALKGGLNLLELKIYENSGPEHLLQTLEETDNLRGVLIDPVPGSLTAKMLRGLDRLGVPVVLFSHCPRLESTKNIFSVVPDWFDSGYRKAEVLLEAGRRRLALLRNEAQGKDGGLVLEGVRQALRDRDVDPHGLICPAQTGKCWTDARRAGLELARKVCASAARRPDAIIYDSINGAIGGLRYLAENGLRVPEEISMVCGGPANNLEEYLTPTLTTVNVSLDLEVRTAFEMIQSGIGATDRTRVCPVTVCRRESSAPPVG